MPTDGPQLEVLASSSQLCFTKQLPTKRVLRRKIEDPPRDVPGVPADVSQIEVLANSSQRCFTRQLLTKGVLRRKIGDPACDAPGMLTATN